MRQKTAKTIEDALRWIHDNEHHKITREEGNFHRTTHIRLENYFERMRIPAAIWKIIGVRHWIFPNQRPYDTRMYGLTKQGRQYLRRRGHILHV